MLLLLSIFFDRSSSKDRCNKKGIGNRSRGMNTGGCWCSGHSRITLSLYRNVVANDRAQEFVSARGGRRRGQAPMHHERIMAMYWQRRIIHM